MGRVFTDVSLVFNFSFFGCGISGFACGLTWRELAASTISNNTDNVLGDGFLGANEFSLLGGGFIRLFDVHLFDEVIIDGDGAVFKIIGLVKDP